jgi:hypothetical protein
LAAMRRDPCCGARDVIRKSDVELDASGSSDSFGSGLPKNGRQSWVADDVVEANLTTSIEEATHAQFSRASGGCMFEVAC